VGLAMDGTEDSTVDPPVITSEALAAVLGISDPEVARDLADGGAQGRELYRAKTEAPAFQWQPAVTERLLKGVVRSLKHGRRPSRRAMADPGVTYLLAKAGVNYVYDIAKARKLKPAERKGARSLAKKQLDKEEFDKLLNIVRLILPEAGKLKEEQRGREGVGLGRRHEQAKTEAVRYLAFRYLEATGELPRRGSRHRPTQFEKYLELVLGYDTGNTGNALAKRWHRYWTSLDKTVPGALRPATPEG
jgi:hypothetical protein